MSGTIAEKIVNKKQTNNSKHFGYDWIIASSYWIQRKGKKVNYSGKWHRYSSTVKVEQNNKKKCNTEHNNNSTEWMQLRKIILKTQERCDLNDECCWEICNDCCYYWNLQPSDRHEWSVKSQLFIYFSLCEESEKLEKNYQREIKKGWWSWILFRKYSVYFIELDGCRCFFVISLFDCFA